MSPIAKWLLQGSSTTTQGDCRLSCQIDRLSIFTNELQFTLRKLDAKARIRADSNFDHSGILQEPC